MLAPQNRHGKDPTAPVSEQPEAEPSKGIILGIESSCDETAAAVVVRGQRTLSNVVASQIATHALYGGVVPELA
ncbi:MAG TPA: hypothetical protein VGD64_02135, partial [Acidisarcina sp.]